MTSVPPLDHQTHRRTARPWLVDYESTTASFSWDEAWNDLGGPPGPEHGVNIADLAIDRHVRAGRGDNVALRWLSRGTADIDAPVDITYAMLATRTNRFASALTRRGLGRGRGLATLAGRIPDLYVAALGTLKA